MGLFRTKLTVNDRLFYESFPQFVPLDALCRGIRQAGNEAGLSLSTEIVEVKAEGRDSQAVLVKGNVEGTGPVEIHIVQSAMGNTHFFAAYWRGLVTFKQSFGLELMKDKEGFFANMAKRALQNQKDAKFARAYDFISIVTDTVIPRAIEIYADEVANGGFGGGGGTGGGTGGGGGTGRGTGGNTGGRGNTGGGGGSNTGGGGNTGGRGNTGGVVTPQPPVRHDTMYNKLVVLTREEAASGCVKVVPLTDGRKAKVTIPAGIKTDSHVDVPGEGRLDESTGKRGILRLSFYIQ